MTGVLRIGVSLLAFFVAVCPAWSASPDLSRIVVIGDSLSAGFQNGSLHEAHQPHGYASLVAAQARAALPLPLIAAPGIPNIITTVDPPSPPEHEAGISSGRIDPFLQPMNLAVPGHTLSDALGRRPDFPISDLTDLILGLPGLFGGAARSQVEWAEALAPSTILVWIGNMDALLAAIYADTTLLTPVAAFESAYTTLMTRLSATGARLVVANIPDVTVAPFLTSPAGIADLTGLPAALVESLLGLAEGDYVTPDAFALIPGILANPASGPLPGQVILTAAEVAQIRSAIASYNAIIAAQAAAHGAALVDIHAFTARSRAEGVVVGGQRLTTEFGGGLFSLDGVHPTNTGYALIANEFIHALGTTFAAAIPPVNIRAIEVADPLVGSGVGVPAGALGHVSPATAASLRAVLGR
jgi:phospholipase/lecithinase/hemolysin